MRFRLPHFYRECNANGMTADKRPALSLAERAVKILRAYLADHRTDRLRDLAEIVVELRGAHHLDDGRPDWDGRSPAYRQTMADIYASSRVPEERLDTVQAALRYHVGNLLRERASADELEAVGPSPVAPRERLANERAALAAQRAVSAPPQDVARLTAYALALLRYVDETKIPDLAPERAVASRLALEAAQERAAELLRVFPKQQTRQSGGRHRADGRLTSV